LLHMQTRYLMAALLRARKGEWIICHHT